MKKMQNINKKIKKNIQIANKNKKIAILVFVIIAISVLIKASYAIYESNLKVTYTSNVGNMVCDISVEKNDSYTVNGIPYFIVTVKNYDENGNITAMDMDYTVTIRNKEGSNGIFIWKNESDNNYIDTY